MKMIIEGAPVSQARMKYSKRGNFVRVYDPREKEKAIIRHQIIEAFQDSNKFHHPVISFLFHMPIPSSSTKKQKKLLESGFQKHEKKPDVDNLIKLYLDCMDGICFDGDQKVMLGFGLKLYHTEPKTVIIIDEQKELLTKYELEHFLLAGASVSEFGKSSSYEIDSLLGCDDLTH